MKKYLLGIFIVILLIGCGDNIKVYTKKQKEEMVKIADENPKAKADLDKLLENLEIKAKEGNKIAENELEEFNHIIAWKVTPAKSKGVDPIKLLDM
ncbi:MAG: hypothetical protein MJH09_01360 [Cetobacterium sp.]|nr:hypothetical protein [Cetobacterium sp.]